MVSSVICTAVSHRTKLISYIDPVGGPLQRLCNAQSQLVQVGQFQHDCVVGFLQFHELALVVFHYLHGFGTHVNLDDPHG